MGRLYARNIINAARREINDDVLEWPFDEILVLHACNIQQTLGFREWSAKHLAKLFLDVSQRRLAANRQRAHITLELEEDYYQHLQEQQMAKNGGRRDDCVAYNSAT